jgi:hypothetical protein
MASLVNNLSKKRYLLLASIIAVAGLGGAILFFSCNSVWHIELNAHFLENYLIWHDPQSFHDKTSRLAKASQALNDSEAGLLSRQLFWRWLRAKHHRRDLHQC